MSKLARRRPAAQVTRIDFLRLEKISRRAALAILALVAGIAAGGGPAAPRLAKAQPIPGIAARVVALNIPGASALAQVGTFLTTSPCGSPIPTKFSTYIQTGAVLDPNRILVGSTSNFGAPLPASGGQQGSVLSIDPKGTGPLNVPPNFAISGKQASALGGAVQMFSANSPTWLNGVNNPNALTAQYTGVSNPLGLSNNNAFGRIWPANSPFGLDRAGSSSILDPTGLPLKGAPNPAIGGVYFGNVTNRNAVTTPTHPQVLPGGLNTGAVGTALLGQSPDGTCRAVFAVVTADGAIVQEHTLKGLDGVAPRGTVRPILGSNGNAQDEAIVPRFGVIMNPYTQAPVALQLFVSEPFYDTIAIVNLAIVGTAPNEVFGLGSVTRISSPALNLPVDLTPVKRDAENPNWASNTTLDDGSDFYVANQGDNTIVRMTQGGMVVATPRVTVNGHPLDNISLNGIAASADATDTRLPTTIFVTFVDPNNGQGGVLAMPAF
jgi:hypothetical protein